MFWIAITHSLAAALPELEELELDPYQRVWGGGGRCDAASILSDAAERIEGQPWTDPAGETIFRNMHVVEAWEKARNCGTFDRTEPIALQMFAFGGVLVAAARNALSHDPGRAADLAVEAFSFGNDASLGGLMSAMVGTVVHAGALDVVAEAWPYLDEEQRARVTRRLRRIRLTSPGLDLEGERGRMRSMAVEIQAHSWLPVAWCVQAHDDVVTRVEVALQSDHPRSLLATDRSPQWLGSGCDVGIEHLALEWLDEQDRIEAELMALENSR